MVNLLGNPLVSLLTLRSKTYGPTDHHLKKMFDYMEREAIDVAYEILYREGAKLARMVKEEINFQPPVWPELNPAYKKWKDKVGLNTDMLKATEAYWNSISIQEVRDSKGRFVNQVSGPLTDFSIRVGVPFKPHPGLSEEQGGDNQKSKLRYDELAVILEYGTEHIPARPHWGPSYRRWYSQHHITIKARLYKQILAKIRNRAILSNPKPKIPTDFK